MHWEGRLAWWFPEPRGILPVEAMHVARSLRRARARFEIRVDTAFEAVIDGCASPSRPHAWINAEIRAAYLRLHRLGWAHSIEAWCRDEGTLGGGLYGLAINGLFAAESKFHLRRDASKVAVLGLVELLNAEPDAGERLIDVQWRTDHLASLGVVEVTSHEYTRRLQRALSLAPPGFARNPATAP